MTALYLAVGFIVGLALIELLERAGILETGRKTFHGRTCCWLRVGKLTLETWWRP